MVTRPVPLFRPAWLWLALFVAASVRPVSAGEAPPPTRVVLDNAPVNGTSHLELQELWRVGGEDDEDNVFGLITQVRTDTAGDIYLLDTQLSHVEVYSPAGEHLRTLSREGDGPGETRLPVDMFVLPDGRVGLVQSFPGKIVMLAADGTPAGSLTPHTADAETGGFLSLTDVLPAGDHLVLGGTRITMGEGSQTRTNFLAACDTTGLITVTYLEKPTTLDFTNLVIDEEGLYFPLFRHMAVGPQGRLFVPVERNRYTLTVFAPDGTPERVLARDIPPWRRTDEDRRKIDAQLDAQLHNLPPQMKVTRKLSDYEPMIQSVSVDRQGRLWVLAVPGTRNLPDGVMAIFDLVSPDGRYLKRVAVPNVGDPDHDSLFLAGDDRLVLVTGFMDAARQLQAGGAAPADEDAAAEPMAVVCYRFTEQ